MSQYFKDTPDPGSFQPAQRGPARSGMALTSMIFGIISLIGFFCFGGLFALIGLILGLIAYARIGKSNGTLSGSGLAMTGVVTSVISLVGSAIFFVYVKNSADSLEGSEQAVSPLVEAERMIMSSKDGKIGYGNSPEAVAIAESFAEQMKAMREVMFSQASSSGISLSDGNFLTYCELDDDSCAILVHVPKLRKFDDEAKDLMCDLAWTVANITLASHEVKQDINLAVGVRGAILYERKLYGKYPDESGEDDDPNYTETSPYPNGLHGFFPEPEPVAEPDSSGENSESNSLPANDDPPSSEADPSNSSANEEDTTPASAPGTQE